MTEQPGEKGAWTYYFESKLDVLIPDRWALEHWGRSLIAAGPFTKKNSALHYGVLKPLSVEKFLSLLLLLWIFSIVVNWLYKIWTELSSQKNQANVEVS